jgi:hypothetical protein
MPDALASSATLPSDHANRHAWALEKYGHLLAKALRKDTSADAREVEKLPEEQIPAQVVSLILEKADPTRNKGMTAWLVRQYGQGHLRLEDLGTANETLTMFRRYASRLGPGQRDLGQYQNLAAVWEAVIGFANDEEQRLSSKAQKALDRDKAYAESRILRQDLDGFTVAVPLTEFAAKWWGKGTRWCTAAEKSNRFSQYHKEAPLIVVVVPKLKENGKFQLWITEDGAQFMDAADEWVSNQLLVTHWLYFAHVLILALRQSGLALEHVPEKLRTDEICSIAVAQNGLALEFVPWDQRTEDMCRIAVAQNGGALEHVPYKLRTEEICRISAARNGEALRYVPEDLLTSDLCKIAITQNGYALWAVPWYLRTEDLCKTAVAQDGSALEYVSWDLRTEDMCRIAVAQNGGAWQHVPQKLRTNEMCRIAVTQNGLALKFVPDALRTHEIYRIAVAQDGGALQYVPDDLRTNEMCSIAVAQDGLALKYVPDKLRTEEICRISVARNAGALRYVPEDLLTLDLCKIAVTQNGYALWVVPEKLRTEELCRTAVVQDGRALRYVPAALQSAVQEFVKLPQPTWDLAILDQWAEAMTPNLVLPLVRIRHA